eukprot:jgi/Chrzof1/5629/Cz16g09160.t1
MSLACSMHSCPMSSSLISISHCLLQRALFRVQSREVLRQTQHVRDEHVVFLAPIRVLFWKTWAMTKVFQTFDASDPKHIIGSFRLVSSVRNRGSGDS